MAARRGHVLRGNTQWEKVYTSIHMLINRIEKIGGLESEGIYRISASDSEVREVDRAIVDDGLQIIDGIDNVHILANLVKRWLIDLEAPLLSEGNSEQYETWLDVAKSTEEPSLLEKVEQAILQMSLGAQEVLKMLQNHVRNVVRCVDRNKMTITNVAVVFAPALIRAHSRDPRDDVKNVGLHTTATALALNPPVVPEPESTSNPSDDTRPTRALQRQPSTVDNLERKQLYPNHENGQIHENNNEELCAADVETNHLLENPRDAFQMFDVDDNGIISTDEFAIMMRAMGHARSDVEMTQLVNQIDLDRSGTIDYLEFELALERNLIEPLAKPPLVSAQEREAVLAGAFRLFDHQEKGSLSRDELVYICRKFGSKDEFSAAELDLLMNDLGLENSVDAGLDYTKFASLLAPTLAPGSFEHT